jgi:hypothetical protein
MSTIATRWSPMRRAVVAIALVGSLIMLDSGSACNNPWLTDRSVSVVR